MVNELMAISAEFVEKLITARAERIVSPYFVDPGVTVRPLAAGERTARERHCAEMTYELMFVLDGAGDVMINDRLYIGGAGTVFLIPRERRMTATTGTTNAPACTCG